MTHEYLTSCWYTLTCPINGNVDEYNGHLVSGDRRVRSVTIFDNDLTDGSFFSLVLLWCNKLTQNALHKTLVWLFVNELHVILKSHEILIWLDIITLTLKTANKISLCKAWSFQIILTSSLRWIGFLSAVVIYGSFKGIYIWMWDP